MASNVAALGVPCVLFCLQAAAVRGPVSMLDVLWQWWERVCCELQSVLGEGRRLEQVWLTGL